MKNILLISVFLLLLGGVSISCDKTLEYESTGIITNNDWAMCACCGGYIIEIEGANYNFNKNELPINNLDLSESNLPLRVKLNWETYSNTCPNLIHISAIEALD